MSTTIGGTDAGYGMLGTLIANSTAVHQQLDTLTEQVSTGLVSQTYAGLGSGAGISLDLNPQLNALSTAQTNINEATGSMQVTQSAMTQIQQIAATFVSDMPNLNGVSSQEVDSIAANAQQALTQVANLLDTQDGDNYVFGGQDSSNPPVPSPNDILSSGFYTKINAAVSALSANGVAATTSATLSIAGSNATGTSPFSAYMSQTTPAISTPIVETGEGGTGTNGIVSEREFRRRINGNVDHRILYARPSARLGDDRFDVQLSGQRSRLRCAGARYHHQPERRRECDGNRRGRPR